MRRTCGYAIALLSHVCVLCPPHLEAVKINGFGQAEILKPEEISLLFNVAFVKPRDRALFGISGFGAVFRGD